MFYDSYLSPYATMTKCRAQRFALPASGQAWTLFGSRKNLKPHKVLENAQTPTCRVHAVLGSFEPFKIHLLPLFPKHS